jgi:alpha-ketoglutarate-dependent taurine dioxygenase
LDQLKLNWKTAIIDPIVQRGFTVITLPHLDDHSFLGMAGMLGSIQKNSNSEDNGISKIFGVNTTEDSKSVISSIKFFPHTDGAYLNGVMMINNKLRKVCPPKLVVLRCVTPAVCGGETTLIDSTSSLSTVIEKQPEILPLVFSRKCMSFSHNDILLTDAPMFSKRQNNNIAIRYSFDNELIVPEETKLLFENLHKLFIHEHHLIKLRPNQILIIDNTRILHGRRAFEGQRVMHRIWIYDNEESIVMSRVGDPTETYMSHIKYRSGLELYNRFSCIEGEPLSDFPLGIKLPKDIDDKLNAIIGHIL